MQYRGIDIVPETLVSQVYLPEKKGSLQIEMVAAARNQGLLAYPIRPDMSAILTQVAAGHPVLVMQNLGYQWMPYWHYAVVVGFDVAENSMILRSGQTKRWQTTFATFERTWARSDYWGRVIVPPEVLPADASLHKWLSAAFDLEQTGQLNAAEIAYQTALINWPDANEATIALANLHYHQAAFERSESIYAELLQQQPKHAAIWNNRAYALQGMRCFSAALSAAQCANKLAPNDSNIQSTMIEMQRNNSGEELICPHINCP